MKRQRNAGSSYLDYMSPASAGRLSILQRNQSSSCRMIARTRNSADGSQRRQARKKLAQSVRAGNPVNPSLLERRRRGTSCPQFMGNMFWLTAKGQLLIAAAIRLSPSGHPKVARHEAAAECRVILPRLHESRFSGTAEHPPEEPVLFLSDVAKTRNSADGSQRRQARKKLAQPVRAGNLASPS